MMEIKTTIRLVPLNQVQVHITHQDRDAAAMVPTLPQRGIYLPPQTTGDIGGPQVYEVSDDEPLTSLNSIVC
jgi:hypothetical protein